MDELRRDIDRLESKLRDIEQDVRQLDASIHGTRGDRESVKNSLWGHLEELRQMIEALKAEEGKRRALVDRVVTTLLTVTVGGLATWILQRILGGG